MSKRSLNLCRKETESLPERRLRLRNEGGRKSFHFVERFALKSPSGEKNCRIFAMWLSLRHRTRNYLH